LRHVGLAQPRRRFTSLGGSNASKEAINNNVLASLRPWRNAVTKYTIGTARVACSNGPTVALQAGEGYLQDVQSAARSLGKQIRVLNAVNEGEIDAAVIPQSSRRA
jgi:hypothetical protein